LFIGSKFTLLGSYYGKTIKNTKGETLKQVDKNRE
jgi:hypothetical protein